MALANSVHKPSFLNHPNYLCSVFDIIWKKFIYLYLFQALPQMIHPRSTSNLSSGSLSSAAGSVQPQQPLQPPVVPPTKPSRPKSNYYEYDYNSHSSQLHHGGVGRTLQDGLNPASFASTGTGTSGSSSSQYYSNSSDHHPSMYSLPRSTSGYP